MTLRYAWIESRTELDGLREDWERLENDHGESCQFFQTWLWVFCWWKHFESDYKKLRILTGTRPGGELALVWPMAEYRKWGLRLLEPAGGRLSCLSDIIVDGSQGPEQAWEWLEGAWQEILSLKGIDVVSFPAVHSRSRLAEFLSQRCGPEISAERCAEIRVGQFRSFDVLLNQLSKGFRKEMRRARRYFESLGNLEHRINDPALPPGEVLTSIYRFKKDWIDSAGLILRPVMKDSAREFLTEYCERCLAGGGEVRICASTLDGKLLAAGVSFVFKGEQFEYIGGFDHAYRLEGPGKVQLSYSIEYSIAAGDRICNLLPPLTEFKERWTKEGGNVFHYILGLNLRGRIYRNLYLRVRPFLKVCYLRIRSFSRRFQ